jgi:hypothetical protein
MSSEVRVRVAVDRIMRTWSLIKLVPEQSSSGTRSSVTKLLLKHPHLTEDELVVVGLKHLHKTDGPKKQQERDFGVDDTSKGSFSDEQVLECLAKAFGKPGRRLTGSPAHERRGTLPSTNNDDMAWLGCARGQLPEPF